MKKAIQNYRTTERNKRMQCRRTERKDNRKRAMKTYRTEQTLGIQRDRQKDNTRTETDRKNGTLRHDKNTQTQSIHTEQAEKQQTDRRQTKQERQTHT